MQYLKIIFILLYRYTCEILMAGILHYFVEQFKKSISLFYFYRMTYFE